MKVLINQNTLIIEFEAKIDYTLAFSYDDSVSKSSKESYIFIELNFSKTKFITLPGSMYILFIISDLVSSNKLKGINIETRIKGCSDKILNALLNFGLINILKTYGNLSIDTKTSMENDLKMRFWKKEVKHRKSKLDILYWPISIIPIKTSIGYENDIGSFMNHFIDYYNMLMEHGMIKYESGDRLFNIKKCFISAVNESVKNVWDHSESWGAASIHSNSENKTTFCLFDYGIGFISSYIKRKGSFVRTVEEDKNILKWLFEEGNTSDEINNHGRGLKKIAEFSDITKGLLLIRTDKYLLQYDYLNKLIISDRPYFPGTQVMINF